ncbi:transporter [Pirellulales bacterium]|nr:transporter [Pirellulales bacterium]
MISNYDYLVIAFYLGFMVAVGLVFRSFNRDSSDYFRGSGSMLWWMCGASALMVNFSAWTFTGAAGMIYENGTLILALYYANVVAFALVYFFTCYRYRQLRVVTYVEAIRNRFGRLNEKVYVWIQIPLFLLNGAIFLNALGVFISSVFGIDLTITIGVVGTVVLMMAITGGAWAVVASDFIQMLTIMAITITAAFLAISNAEVGGISGLLEQAPAAHFDWSLLGRLPILGLWVVALLFSQSLAANNLSIGASRYLMVKDGRHARRAALIPMIGMLVLPVVWIIPPIAATITNPDLAAEFPNLKTPNEAAFVAISLKTMPQGLVGLLVCGIFAATMSTMDSELNASAGIFVRNLYRPTWRPEASEAELLRVGKAATAVFGILTIAAGALMSLWREMGLFQLVLQVAGKIEIPLVVPMLLGMFVRRTPAWVVWSTVLMAMSAAWIAPAVIDADVVESLMGWSTPLTTLEADSLNFAVTILAVVVFGGGWYFLGSWLGTWFGKPSSPAYRHQEDEFFVTMNTPIDPAREKTTDVDHAQYRLLGIFCLVYGGFVALLALIPNELVGRFCFVFCGGLVFAVGGLLYSVSRASDRPDDDM